MGALVLAPGAGGVPGDPTPPVVIPVYSPALPSNGWFRGNVTLNWSVSDSESVILETIGCDSKTLTADTAGTQFTCSARSDGGTTTITPTVRVDKTPPTVVAAATRAPDANGWYNRPVSISFSGTDATSQIASCAPAATYAGPDNAQAAVAGTCTDNAGNVATASVGFKYDATAPALAGVAAKVGNRSVQLSWRKSSDTQAVEVVRAPGRGGQGETMVYRGAAAGFHDKNLDVGRKYQYRVAGLDEAANRVERLLDVMATGRLLSPAPGAVVKGLPKLVWTPVKRASYYNLQLIRGHRILSVWPARPGYRLRRTWTYKGRRYRLRPGVYRWYVWPGYGRISASKYGSPLGSSTFVVSK